MKPVNRLKVMMAACVFASTAPTHADFYQYIDRDGVSCFTDAPTTSEAVLVIRDGNRHRNNGGKKVPSHLSATGIAGKIRNEGRSHSDSSSFTLPIDGRITSLSGMRHDPIDGTLRMHNGVDIAAPAGTPVKPAIPGKVIFSGTRPGYGNMIILEHDDGTITVYAHNLANLKQEGEFAGAGDTIALIGSTGRSTGPHLHFEAWKDGVNITSSFVGSGSSPHTGESSSDAIRISISPDGSLRFSNLN